LLNHSSGFADYTHFVGEEERRAASYAELLAPVRAQPLASGPGDCVSVNPTNTLLLAALVEQLAGRPAEVELAARIFGPLELEDSGYSLALAVPASAQKDVELQPRAFAPERLFTSARDLVRFQRGLVDLELLGSADLERMRSATRLSDGRLEPCGMGSQLMLAGSSEGTTMGAGHAAVTYFPEHDLTVAVLARGVAPRADRLVLKLAESVIEVPEQGIVDLYLTRAEMRPYLGTFYIGCNTLLVLAGEGRIVLDRTEEGRSVLLYQGGHRFVARDDPGLELQFTVEGARAESFTLIEHGLRSIARRIDG
jgi:CubicO group peptidase (beta-lactamase class C family)